MSSENEVLVKLAMQIRGAETDHLHSQRYAMKGHLLPVATMRASSALLMCRESMHRGERNSRQGVAVSAPLLPYGSHHDLGNFLDRNFLEICL
jgi:hypothetical protein